MLWFPKVRANTRSLFLISLVILVGMWLERFVIIVTSLQPRLPAVFAGAITSPTRWDYATYLRNPGLVLRWRCSVHPRHAGDFDLRNARLLLPEAAVEEVK